MQYNIKKSLYLFLILTGASILYSAKQIVSTTSDGIPTTVEDVTIQPQADLTEEELKILELIQQKSQQSDSNSKINNKDNKDDKREIDPAEQREIEHIKKFMNEKLNTLERFYNERIQAEEKELKEVEDRFNKIKNATEELFLKYIYEFNTKQLRKVLERITQVVHDELERRDKKPEIVYASDEEDEKDEDEEMGNFEEEHVTKEALDQALSLSTLIDRSESIIIEAASQQFSDFIKNEIIAPLSQTLDKDIADKNEEFTKAQNSLQVEKANAQERAKTSENRRCLDIIETFNMVQASLWKYQNDGGKYDHLADNGAVIVYGDEWTSRTYSVPSSTEESIALSDYEHYIPEDWERLLPSSWKDIRISSISSFFKNPSIWYSLPLPLKNFVSPSSGSVVGKPPETIMSKDNYLGSCWAMAGSSGKVTLRLHDPMSVQSITIDHFPGLKTAYDTDKEENINTSAPRFIRVVGYPLCDAENEGTLDCMKLGFDKSRPINLGSLEYKPLFSSNEKDSKTKRPTRSSQTFAMDEYPSVASNCGSPEVPTCENQYSDHNSVGSYSSSGASCGETYYNSAIGSCNSNEPSNGAKTDNSVIQRPIVAAISLFIDENWGNEKFTCLYRVRVHSD